MSSRRSWDKFSFLEAIISAESKLLIFYEGRKSETGDELQPSILVNELKGYLDIHFKSNCPVHSEFSKETDTAHQNDQSNEKKFSDYFSFKHPIQPLIPDILFHHTRNFFLLIQKLQMLAENIME